VDIEEIRAARLAHPFRPFNLVLQDGQMEIIDPALVVSIRTIYAANIADFPRNGANG
jgi:hypothetical protein